MTKKMGLMALGLSMALLSGCGSSSDEGTTDPNTPDEVAKNIVGTWMTGCMEDDPGWFYVETLTFNANGTGSWEEKEYDAAGCNEADLTETESDNFTYEIGEATQGADGKDAVEIDVTGDQMGDLYTMVRFHAGKLCFADSDEGDINDGTTPAKRENDFSEPWWPFTKQ